MREVRENALKILAAVPAEFAGVPFLEIRAVSDCAGESAPDEFERNIPKAMRNATHVLDILSRQPAQVERG